MYKLLFFLTPLLFVACKEDKSVVNLREIKGSWDIIQATKDGQVFEAILGGYFEFSQDDKFQTNIPTLPTGASYTVKENTISFSTDTLKYNITEVTDSILVLESNIRGVAFQFMCKKRGI